ncbi:helix-turn-helix transcriptional regulator [Microbacterium sp. TPU 3598]|uniref:helix-turn-helix transcriptional regulator n=1 Tax=Microbacterium sp. TPU 3598 TaxID=1938334 RepID=UPI0012FE5E5F|nr:helix-turn-helix transcriptional regulator [Microbacterium sp. TPU 3598]
MEASTMRRVFAKSGGNVGLALSIMSVAIREGRVRRLEGTWAAVQDLWSAGLRGSMEAQLEDISAPARDALEVITMLDDAGVDTVIELVDWPTLEMLENRGMIRMVMAGERQLVTVVPPLLTEFFQHEGLLSRRLRLSRHISDRVGTERPEQPFRELSPSRIEPDAALVRLIHKRTHARTLAARARWEVCGQARSVWEYATALINAGADPSAVDAVLERPIPFDSDALSVVRLAVLQARWWASAGDVEKAASILTGARTSAGCFAGIIAAAQVRLSCEQGHVPEDFASSLEVGELMPDPVRAAVWDTQILVLNTLGRFTDAARVYAAYEADRRAAAHMTGDTRAQSHLTLLGLGRGREALALSLRAVDESFGLLDVDAARAHGVVAVVCLMMSGDNDPVEDLVSVLTAAGPFPRCAAAQQRVLLTLAAVVAIRKGKTSVGERYLDQLGQLPGQDGLLPGQSPSWARAQRLAFEGGLRDAAALLWNAGDDLWGRGGRAAGLASMLNACEIRPDPKWMAVVAERAPQVHGGLFAAQHAFVKAVSAENGDQLVSAFECLDDTGRRGLAVSALRRATLAYRAAGAEARARAVEARSAEYLDVLAHQAVDADRFATTTVKLTDREVEIARLVAEGMSNPAIASHLVLSIRTVESHMHRIMRKLALPNRQSVGDYILNQHRS